MKKNIKSVICLFLVFVFFSNSIIIKADDEEVKKSFFDYKTARHAMGGWGDDIYNNHETALKNSIANGGTSQFIELDLMLTTDGKLVCSHGVNKSTCKNTGIKYKKSYSKGINYSDFMKLKIQGIYPTMDAKKWAKYVKNYKDIVWELDLRTLDKEQSKKIAKAIVDTFNENSNYLDKFLIQVGSKEMYEGINEVYSFKYYQYYLHENEVKDINNILAFCKDKGFTSIAVHYNYMTEDLVKTIKDSGLKLLCHTVDDKEKAVELLKMGADTICTNFLFNQDVAPAFGDTERFYSQN